MRATRRRVRLKVCGAAVGLMLASAPARAEDSQIRPFLGATFGGGTTFVDLEKAAGKPNMTVGVNASWLGEIAGVDVDLGDSPGFFQAGNQHLVLASRVTTLTGNFVLAAPRKLTEYSLRPYLVGGAGMMRVRIDDYFGVLRVAKSMPGFDVGGGAIGFLTNRIGVCWDIRRFKSLGRNPPEGGLSFGGERLSFWRATMGVAIRY